MPPVDRWRASFAAVPPNVQGMLWVALSGLIFSTFMALVRHVGSHMAPIQVSFMRYGFGLLFLVPFFLRVRLADVAAANWNLHALPGLLPRLGVLLSFSAFRRIPLSDFPPLVFPHPFFPTPPPPLFPR